MAFNISEFKSQNKFGFLKPAYFLARINPPPWNRGLPRDFLYLIAAATLPGVQILTQESKIYGQGPTVKMPYDIGVTDMTMRIYASGNGQSIKYFYDWVRAVVNLDIDQVGGEFGGAFSNQISYRNEYVTSVDIIVFSETGSEVIQCTLHDAYPVSIAETALDRGSTGEVMTFNVTWAFRAYTMKTSPVPAYGGGGGTPAGDIGNQATEPQTQSSSIARQLRENAMMMTPPTSSSLSEISSTLSNAFSSAVGLLGGGISSVSSTLNSLSSINSTLNSIESQLSGAVSAVKNLF